MRIIAFTIVAASMLAPVVASATTSPSEAATALESACPAGTCDPAAEKATAATIEGATKAAALADLEAVVVLRDKLVALAPKAASPLGKALDATKKAIVRISDDELRARLDARRWADARAWIAERGKSIDAAWEKKAQGTHGAALEKVVRSTKPAVTRDELVALTDEYAPLAGAEGAPAPLKKALTTTQTALGKLLDKELAESLAAYDYAAAEQLLETHAPRVGKGWTDRAKASIAKKRTTTTELVDACSKAKKWDACTASLESLVSACENETFTCNATARGVLRQTFTPLVNRKDTTEEQRLALGHTTDRFEKLAKNDPIRQLGQAAYGVVRRDVEGRVRKLASAGEFGEARAIAASYEKDFGETWTATTVGSVDREEQRQIAIAEAQERAKMAECMGVCQVSIVPCDHDPWSACHPAPSDCERTCRMISGW
jgi:hypothetical protein